MPTHVLSGAYRPHLSSPLVDATRRGIAGKLRSSGRRMGLDKVFTRLSHIDQCIHSKDGLLFLVQQPRMEFVLRTTVLSIISIPCLVCKKHESFSPVVGGNNGIGICRDALHSRRRHKGILVRQPLWPRPRLPAWNGLVTTI